MDVNEELKFLFKKVWFFLGGGRGGGGQVGVGLVGWVGGLGWM